MPCIYNFEELIDLRTLEIEPNGWKLPIIVEYGFGNMGETVWCIWRVKGTTHSFRILLNELHYLSSGNYKQHFEETLDIFREDYLVWKNQNFFTEWMQEYQTQFKNLIK